MNLNPLAPELSELFRFVATSAVAIRSHSAHNPDADLSRLDTAIDVRWLSDAIHNVDQFGSAITNNNARHMAAACEAHIDVFTAHLKTSPRTPYAPAGTFARHRAFGLDLEHVIAVLVRLRAKCLAQANQNKEDAAA